jgi:hypothetical protein
MLFDARLDGIEHPDGDENQKLGTGDLRAPRDSSPSVIRRPGTRSEDFGVDPVRPRSGTTAQSWWRPSTTARVDFPCAEANPPKRLAAEGCRRATDSKRWERPNPVDTGSAETE